MELMLSIGKWKSLLIGQYLFEGDTTEFWWFDRVFFPIYTLADNISFHHTISC